MCGISIRIRWKDIWEHQKKSTMTLEKSDLEKFPTLEVMCANYVNETDDRGENEGET